MTLERQIQDIAAALKVQRESIAEQMKRGDDSSLTTTELIERLRELQSRVERSQKLSDR